MRSHAQHGWVTATPLTMRVTGVLSVQTSGSGVQLASAFQVAQALSLTVEPTYAFSDDSRVPPGTSEEQDSWVTGSPGSAQPKLGGPKNSRHAPGREPV